ncbi:MAG: hypothetical protein J7M13_07720, partial [Synergistetes bacterium]|nr:hypothetical protein [Synergistota bacterium]
MLIKDDSIRNCKHPIGIKVAGLSTEDIEGKSSTPTVMLEILAFIAGLSSIFIALGYSAGAL